MKTNLLKKILFLAILISFFWRFTLLQNTTFNAWDEAEYGILAREFEKGHYTLMGDPFKLHPPFFPMLLAAFNAVSGLGLLSYRLVSSIMAMMTSFGVYLFGERLKKNAGLYASLLLLLSPLFFHFSSWAFIDVTFSFFLLMVLYSHLFSRKFEWLVIISSALIKLSSIMALFILNMIDFSKRNLKRGWKIYLPYLFGYGLWRIFSFIDTLRLGDGIGHALWTYDWFLEGMGKVVPPSSREGTFFYLQNLDFVLPGFTLIFLLTLAVLLINKKEELILLAAPLIFLTLWSVKTIRYFVQFTPIMLIPVGLAFSILERKNRWIPVAILLLVALPFAGRVSWMEYESREWLDAGAYLHENTADAILSTSPMEAALYSGRRVEAPYSHTLEEFKELEPKTRWIVLAERYEFDFKEIHRYLMEKELNVVQDVPFAGIMVVSAPDN